MGSTPDLFDNMEPKKGGKAAPKKGPAKASKAKAKTAAKSPSQSKLAKSKLAKSKLAKSKPAKSKTPRSKSAKSKQATSAAAVKPVSAKPNGASKPAAKSPPATTAKYTAKDIEVLEGLEPVRRRPGMYIGGTDEQALHHMAAEVIDNAMDEVVAGHADWIEFELDANGYVTVRDNGRGIPIDPHPKFKVKSALEVILTTLHSGGKFGSDAYKISGGLHGVGISVVNALSDDLTVEVARDRKLWTQKYSRGVAEAKLKDMGAIQNRRGTTVRFHPDPKIFGKDAAFKPARLYRMARAKAYLIRGVQIRWACDESLVPEGADFPAKETLRFPNGLADFLKDQLGGRACFTPAPFAGDAEVNGGGRVEWAVAWPGDLKGFASSYVNTVPTPQGGSHEAGIRMALTRGLRAYGELIGNKKAAGIAPEDVMDHGCILLSLFITDPQFQGQTKDRLGMPAATRLVENAIRDHFDHWLSADPVAGKALLEHIVDRMESRERRKAQREMERKSATRKLRLPGKLADCSKNSAEGTEVFLVEGDSAGGSAKQARNRATQAILPLRGKILNVASATVEKQRANQELADLIQALGCGTGPDCDPDKLRYERVIIMTDADVDGAHIASLLLTFFFKEMPAIIEAGNLYLAMPPLYRISQGSNVAYARDDAHKDELLNTVFTSNRKTEISRFKGLGEMPPAQLKETTMDPGGRILLRVTMPDTADPAQQKAAKSTASLVDALMGKKAELRFKYIQENAKFVDAEALDV